eukprot:TRINITY_DN2748_c0_g1_i1.p1 TRINITY_DN2748_c0_g1~~TRINITY_DN2748_c0_g1_i1.p1  ORF type:complete len:1551 (+),score=370.32 TRINITY_DN2748_c0_g1_i1:18-4670(+)
MSAPWRRVATAAPVYLLLLTLIFAVCVSVTSGAQQLFLSPDGSDSGNCASSATACLTLQYALQHSTPGNATTVEFLAGRYIHIRRTVISNSHVMLRAFAGANVVIDCENVDWALSFDTSTEDVTLDSLSFTRCAADALPAVSVYGLQLTVRNCSFTDNSQGSYGAAIYSSANVRSLTVYDSLFSGNSAFSGAAIYLNMTNLFTSNVSISNSVFESNTASYDGAAITAHTLAGVDSVFTVTECWFTRNTAEKGSSLAMYATQSANYNPTADAPPAAHGLATTATVPLYPVFNVNGCMFMNNQGTSNAHADGTVFYKPFVLAALKVAASNFISNSLSSRLGGAAVGLNPYADGNITFIDCVFQSNEQAANYGGFEFAMKTAWYGNYLLMRNCSFIEDGVYISGAHSGGNTVLEFDGCYMTGSTSGVSLEELAISDQVTAIVRNSLFEYNIQTVLSINSRVDVINCTFSNNYADEGGAITNANLQLLTVTNCSFIGNMAVERGGAIYTGIAASPVFITRCTFIENVAPNGGAIYLSEMLDFVTPAPVAFLCDECAFIANGGPMTYGGAVLMDPGMAEAVTEFRQCTFRQNTANEGGGIYISSGYPSLTGNTVMQSNQATVGSVVYLMMGLVTIDRVWFKDNIAISSGTLFGMLGAIDITNSTFYNNTARQGGALSLVSVDVSVNETNFVANSAPYGYAGAIYVSAMSTTLSIVGGLLQENTAWAGGALFAEVYSVVSLQGVQVLGNHALTDGGALFSAGTLMVEHNRFVGNVAGVSGGSMAVQNSAFVSQCEFIGNSATNGGAIAVDGVGSMELDDCQFISNAAEDTGGAIDWAPDNVQASGDILNSQFHNNSARHGGALAIRSSNVVVSNCNITFSIAVLGGAIYAAELVELRDMSFVSNAAAIAGGVVFWLGGFTQPSCNGACNFEQNSAGYGARYATPPLTLQADLRNISSANSFTFEVTALDFYGHVASTAGGQVSMSLTNGNQGCILGGASTQFYNGIATISAVLEAPQNVSVTFLANSFKMNGQAINTTVVQIPHCGVGAATSPSATCGFACQSCAPSTYNVNGDGVCLVCPEGAVCQGARVWSTTGYWTLFDHGTVVVEQCEQNQCLSAPQLFVAGGESPDGYFVQRMNADAAQTGAVAQWNETFNRCDNATFRTGFMCAQCIEGYSEWNGNCVDCTQPKPYLAVLYVLFGNWAVVIMVHILLSGQSGSGFASLLIDYVQTVQLLLPTIIQQEFVSLTGVLSLLNIQLPTGGNGVCVFPRPLGYYNQAEQTYAIALISLIQVCLSFAIGTVIARIRGAWLDTRRWLVRPLLSQTLAIYTPLTAVALALFTCRNIGSFAVLRASVWQVCTGALYNRFYVIAIVTVTIVSAGLPLVAGLLLLRKRAQLKDHSLRLWLGTLYEQYSERTPWWGLVLLVRRTVLSSLLIIGEQSLRHYLAAVWVSLMLLMQLVFSPRQSSAQNYLQAGALASLSIIALTVVAAAQTAGSVLFALGIVIVVLFALTIAAVSLFSMYMERARIAAVLRRVRGLCRRLRTKSSTEEEAALLVQ